MRSAATPHDCRAFHRHKGEILTVDPKGAGGISVCAALSPFYAPTGMRYVIDDIVFRRGMGAREAERAAERLTDAILKRVNGTPVDCFVSPNSPFVGPASRRSFATSETTVYEYPGAVWEEGSPHEPIMNGGSIAFDIERYTPTTPREVAGYDLAAFNTLFHQLTDGTLTAVSSNDVVAAGTHGTLLVARSLEGFIVGTATALVVHTPRSAYCAIEDVVVASSFQGNGIGSGLIRELAIRADDSHVDSMFHNTTFCRLTSHPGRRVARAMYEKRGFSSAPLVVMRCNYPSFN